MALGLYDSSSYPDLLRNLQIYSAQRRAATGRGLTPQEMQGAIRGLQETENARKMEMYKTRMATSSAEKINANNVASNAWLTNKEIDIKHDKNRMEGLLSIPGMAQHGMTTGMMGNWVYNKLNPKPETPALTPGSQFNNPDNNIAYAPDTSTNELPTQTDNANPYVRLFPDWTEGENKTPSLFSMPWYQRVNSITQDSSIDPDSTGYLTDWLKDLGS